MSAMQIEAFFLATPRGRRFCLFHPPSPSQRAAGAVLYIHPFAEEMNKSRRMAALQAQAFAAAGYAVLQIDLHGCGDSEGDFGDASWDGWVEDVLAANNWLKARSGPDVWLWGLRAGCLIAAAASHLMAEPAKLLLWQPVLSGKQFLQQFLRLKMAGAMLGGEDKEVLAQTRQQLTRGEAVEIAGYRLSAALAAGLEEASLTLPATTQRVLLLEIAASGSLSPLAASRLKQWQEEGHDAQGGAVAGPAFWQTTEIETCPALIEASLQGLQEVVAA